MSDDKEMAFSVWFGVWGIPDDASLGLCICGM